MNGLAARGHNITVLSVEKEPDPPPNVSYIYVEGVHDYIYNDAETDLIALAYTTPLEAVDLVYSYSTNACRGIQRAKGWKTLLNYPNTTKFDVVLYDFTLGPCLLGFLHKFNYPPLVSYSAFNNPPYTQLIAGGHNYFGYKPYLTTKYNNRMTFWERAHNLMLYAVDY